MPNTPAGMRECPTRADGTNALFAHVITTASCQERQRQHYHKCPLCSFYNARANGRLGPVALNGKAEISASRLPPLDVPSRRGADAASAELSPGCRDRVHRAELGLGASRPQAPMRRAPVDPADPPSRERTRP